MNQHPFYWSLLGSIPYYINVNPSELTFTYESGMTSGITISSNTSYTITASDSWFNVDILSSSGDTIVIVETLSQNTDSVNRTGTVTIENTLLELNKVVTITQTFEPQPIIYIYTSTTSGFTGEITSIIPTIVTAKSGTFTMYLQGSGTTQVDWGNGDIETIVLNDTVNSYSHYYTSGGSITISEMSGISYIDASSQLLTECNIPSTCSGIRYIDLTGCQLNSFTAYPEWTKLEQFYLSGTFTSLTTYAEWINISNILIDAELTTFTTYPEWINLTYLNIANNILTSLIVYTEWTKFEQLYAYYNAISETYINNILIVLDTIMSLNTYSYIYLNGDTNAAPTGDGIIAMNNLIARGIHVITN